MGDNAIEVLLVPVFREMSMNLEKLVKSGKSALAHVQIHRCLHALTVRMER